MLLIHVWLIKTSILGSTNQVVRLKEADAPVTNALSRNSRRTSDETTSIGDRQDGSDGGGMVLKEGEKWETGSKGWYFHGWGG